MDVTFTGWGGVTLDYSHCWLIEIGDSVTLAPGVRLIAHDASTKMFLDYAKIGKIKIGNNVFVGAASVILPNVSIGNNVIIGANSTVTHDIPENSVAVGNPAKVICSIEEYLNKEKTRMKECPVYDASFTSRHGITYEKKLQMQNEIKTIGFVK